MSFDYWNNVYYETLDYRTLQYELNIESAIFLESNLSTKKLAIIEQYVVTNQIGGGKAQQMVKN